MTPQALFNPPPAEACTVSAVRRLLAESFRSAGIETPELDARVLIAHALARDHAGLAAAGHETLDANGWHAIVRFAERRLRREPVARIVGFKEFWSLKFQVDATTLVPRPETETVVEAALAEITPAADRTRALLIADLGTGSGAILLALLSELPNAFGVGTDTSPRGAAACAAQRPTSSAWAGGFRGLRSRRRARRIIRSCCREPALCRLGRDRQACARRPRL